MFGPVRASTQVALEGANAHAGKVVQILLPIEVEGVINEYMFVFKVNGVSIKQL